MDEEDRNGSKTSRRRQGKGKRRRSAVWADDDDDVSRRMTSKVDEMLSTKMTSSPLKLKFVVQSTKKSRQEELPSKKFNSDDNSFRLSTDSSPLSTEFTSPSKLRMKISMTNKTVAMSHDITNDTVDESFDGNSVESSVDNSSKKKSSRVAEFIADRSSRVKSYFRRRHAPFKRTFDLDLQCGTKSLLVQVCDDIEECLYFGHDKLVEKFLSSDGINLQHANELIQEGIRNRETADFEDIDARSSTRATLNVMAGEDSNDDDYMPTVKEKEKVEKEKRREMQQKLQDGEYLADINDRSKVFKSRKESLIGKIRETDSVCGTKSFLLILNLDQEGAFYHGDLTLATLFFTTGLTSKTLGRNFNVRLFEIDELDQNKCSVSHCTVSRNLLSRWRLAAIDMFKFPPHLPMNLHICPEAERDKWISDLHLDPNSTGKIAVCSLHFKEGHPTPEFPSPTELLSTKDSENATEFRGTNATAEPEKNSDHADAMEMEEESALKVEEEKVKKVHFKKLLVKKAKNHYIQTPLLMAKAKHRKALAALRKRRKWIPSNICGDAKMAEIRRRLFATSALFGSRIACKFCSQKFVGTRNYFQHVRQDHIQVPSQTVVDQSAVKPDSVDESSEKSVATTEVSKQPKKFKPQPIKFETGELGRYLELFYPKSKVRTMNQKKKYVCATCKSNFDLFGLYSHMKQVHGGLLCQFCLKLFKKVSEIEVHLKNVHKVSRWYYHSPKMFTSYAGKAYSFVCSICNELLSGKQIEQHKCNKVGPRVFDCPNCDRTFPHQRPLEIHISNGWCHLGKRGGGNLAAAKLLANPGFERVTEESECAKRFKVLSGKEPNFFMLPAKRQNNVVVNAVAATTSSIETTLTSSTPTASSSATKKPVKFSISDRTIWSKFNVMTNHQTNEKVTPLEDLPETGSIFCGTKARGVNSEIRKEIKESKYNWKIRNLESGLPGSEILRAGNNFFLDSNFVSSHSDNDNNSDSDPGRKSGKENEENFDPKSEAVTSRTEDNSFVGIVSPIRIKTSEVKSESKKEKVSIKIPVKKESKSERLARQIVEIEACLDKLRLLVDHHANESNCLFCQQARVVTVDAVFLLSHLIVVHDRDVVEERLGENAEAAILRIRTHLRDTRKDEVIFRYSHELSPITYSCCYCDLRIDTDYEKLFSHLSSSHNSKVLNCHLCQNIFLNYGSFVSHVCFGPMQQQQLGKTRAKFVCPICERKDLATFLDFQFHVRKHHNVCEICLHSCPRQEELHDHCLTHSQELMCMKCFLTFDDINQFRKHLFYKHESEHTICKDCHQKTWPHVYHFCIQPNNSICEVCDKTFDNVKQYRVHIRTHTGNNPYSCTVRGCNKSYISKQLLLKHQVRRHPELRASASKILEDRRNHRLCLKFGAKNMESIHFAEDLLEHLIAGAVLQSETPPPPPPEEVPSQERVESPDDKSVLGIPADNSTAYLDPVDAAVRSIMGPEGSFDLHMSPTKSLSHILNPLMSPPQTAPRPPSPVKISSPLHPYNGDSSLLLDVKPSKEMENDSKLPDRMSPESKPSAVLINNNTKMDNSATDEAHSDVEMNSPSHKKPELIGEKKKLTNGHDVHLSTSKEDEDVDDENDSEVNDPVIGGIWNQDLFFVSQQPSPTSGDPAPKKGCKVMKPRYQGGGGLSGIRALPPTVLSPQSCDSPIPETPKPEVRTPITHFDATTISKKLETGGWDVMLSESSDSENDGDTPRVRIIERVAIDKRLSIRDHDYCFDSFMASQRPPTPPPALARIAAPTSAKLLPPVRGSIAQTTAPVEDLSEMDKIANNVAMGVAFDRGDESGKKKQKRKKESKKKKKKKKKHKRNRGSSSSDSETELDVTGSRVAGKPLAESTPAPTAARRGPKPKYHTSMTGRGVTAGTARPRFSSSSDDDDVSSNDNLSDAELASSDLDTDFSAEEKEKSATPTVSAPTTAKRTAKPTPKVAETLKLKMRESRLLSTEEEPPVSTPTLKLKIKLPPSGLLSTPTTNTEMEFPKSRNVESSSKKGKSKLNSIKLKMSTTGARKKTDHYGFGDYMSTSKSRKKSTDSRSKRHNDTSASDSENDDIDALHVDETVTTPLDNSTNDKLYCVCQCPHDDVSEMIGCDGPECRLEWFHFECVGIMVPPKGKWYCPECTERFRIKDRRSYM